MSYDLITYETRDDVGWITLNRPDKLNAWTPAMSVEMADALERANADRSVGAVVLTGAGRGFCAGADMEQTFAKRISGEDPGEGTDRGSGGLPDGLDWVKLVRESKPMIAAVNGACVGIGLTQILPFDVILASEKAKFGMLFIKVGLVPELASTHFLSQRIGFGKASELSLSGRIMGAVEAERVGLADRLVAPEALIETAAEIARSFAANPDPQLRMTKRLLTENATATDLTAIQERESALLRECWKTPEHAEAVDAFIEKRDPVFR